MDTIPHSLCDFLFLFVSSNQVFLNTTTHHIQFIVISAAPIIQYALNIQLCSQKTKRQSHCRLDAYCSAVASRERVYMDDADQWRALSIYCAVARRCRVWVYMSGGMMEQQATHRPAHESELRHTHSLYPLSFCDFHSIS